MTKQYKEAPDEFSITDIEMAAAYTGPFWDSEGKEHKGIEFKRVQDTAFDDTKEIVFKKGKEANEASRLYMNRLMRVEPLNYMNTVAKYRDLVKGLIKATSSHNIHKETLIKEEHDE